MTMKIFLVIDEMEVAGWRVRSITPIEHRYYGEYTARATKFAVVFEGDV